MNILIEQFPRFWSRVNFDAPNDCWEWPITPTQQGYGIIQLDGRAQKAHRVSYLLLVGAIPDGLTIDHLCRNRACVNPDHLEAVTNKINVLRGQGVCAMNAHKTRCPQGHDFVDTNIYTYPNGRRGCRSCRKSNSTQRYQEKLRSYRK